jgi:hypothetical protein
MRGVSTDKEALVHLQWLRDRGISHSLWGIGTAAYRGYVESLHYMLAEGGVVPKALDTSTTTTAAYGGHLECMQMLHTAGFPVNANTAVCRAAEEGRLPMVRWLVETPGLEAPLTEELAKAAARSGSLELLRYLHERDCPWDERTWSAAVRNGSQEMREWLQESGCPTQVDVEWQS